MTTIYIETSNLILRQFLPSDSKDLSYYSQQPNVAYWLSDMVFPDESHALSWINRVNKDINTTIPCVVLAIETKAEGICIGLVGVHPKAEIDNEVEILYGISDNYQGKGYGAESSKALIQWIFKNTSLHSLTAIVKPDNIPSKNLTEKLGFKYINTKLMPCGDELCAFNYYKLYNNHS